MLKPTMIALWMINCRDWRESSKRSSLRTQRTGMRHRRSSRIWLIQARDLPWVYHLSVRITTSQRRLTLPRTIHWAPSSRIVDSAMRVNLRSLTMLLRSKTLSEVPKLEALWTRTVILSSSDNRLALRIRMNLASLKTLSMISRSRLMDSETV